MRMRIAFRLIITAGVVLTPTTMQGQSACPLAGSALIREFDRVVRLNVPNRLNAEMESDINLRAQVIGYMVGRRLATAPLGSPYRPCALAVDSMYSAFYEGLSSGLITAYRGGLVGLFDGLIEGTYGVNTDYMNNQVSPTPPQPVPPPPSPWPPPPPPLPPPPPTPTPTPSDPRAAARQCARTIRETRRKPEFARTEATFTVPVFIDPVENILVFIDGNGLCTPWDWNDWYREWAEQDSKYESTGPFWKIVTFKHRTSGVWTSIGYYR